MSQPIFNHCVNDVAWSRCYAVGNHTKSAKHHFRDIDKRDYWHGVIRLHKPTETFAVPQG